jgi:hypothetical protein
MYDDAGRREWGLWNDFFGPGTLLRVVRPLRSFSAKSDGASAMKKLFQAQGPFNPAPGSEKAVCDGGEGFPNECR